MDSFYCAYLILMGLLPAFAGVGYSCGYPGSPAHSEVIFNTDTVQTGTVASYLCEPGFDLLGPTRRLCLENGTWIPPGIPVCVLNVALEKASMQSSVSKGSQKAAVDGNSDSCTSMANETKHWWYVNLLEPFNIHLIRIDFGQSCCESEIPFSMVVRVGNNRPDIGKNAECNRIVRNIERNKPVYLPCNSPLKGAFVSIHIENRFPFSLSICEAFVYTDEALSLKSCPAFMDQKAISTYNGKCFAFHSFQPKTFQDARRHCTSENDGALIHSTSPALQGFLSWELYKRHRKTIDNRDYWNGVVWNHNDNTSGWKWYDGEEVTLSFWSKLPSVKNCSKFDGANGWLWTGSFCDRKFNFICQHTPISCGNPSIPPNATMTSRMNGIGKEVAYKCREGHLLVGSSMIFCKSSGFYSDFAPTCLYLECGNPAVISNGNYTLWNGSQFYYKSVVKYFCLEGYLLVGREFLVCESDRKWDGPPPRCDPLICHDPPSIEFGNVTLVIAPSNGTLAEYSCQKGFYLAGHKTIECDSKHLWLENAPTCRVDRSGIDINSKKRRNKASVAARLNMGGIISLGIFGGFVFLAAVISIVVIIIRRNSTKDDGVGSCATVGSCERLYEHNACYEHSPIGHHTCSETQSNRLPDNSDFYLGKLKTNKLRDYREQQIQNKCA